jgi:(E)-2-((N-methylformamido)methylene)succinate hydrolase
MTRDDRVPSLQGAVTAPPEIHYRREGSGPAVLLIHGVGGDSTNWAEIAPRLATRFDVISMDLRGHGKSGRIAGALGVEDLARDALQVMDAAGIATCRVVGMSLGGVVAQSIALNFPERVEKLAVIGTVSGRTPEQRAKALERIEFLKQQGLRAVAEGNRERWFSEEFQREHPEIVAARVAQVMRTDPESYRRAFTVFCTADFADRLHEIAVPTLVIAGEHDIAATPAMAHLMGERISGAQVHVLPRLRHSLLIEASEQVTSLLEAFL